ncbi:MAG: hypothetical protein ACREEP_18555 [Dongiaceae bacterium]
MNHGQGVASFHVMRVLWCVGFALALAWRIAPAVAQEATDRCTAPPMVEAEALDPQAFWDDDREVFVWRRQDSKRYAYRIVGDIVELTPKLFSALVTEPGQSLGDVSEIEIDAREIVLAMPIRLKDGTIRLHADNVRFTGDGSISLIDPPTRPGQLVEIIADSLDLSHAPDMPFVFSTQGWVLNGAPQWPAAGGPNRLLRIKTRTIVADDNATDVAKAQLKDDPLRWVHNRTADQGFDSGFPKSQWSAGYDIGVGKTDGGIYDGIFTSSLRWPDMSAAKLSRLRVRAPFDPAVDAFIRAKIEELEPRLARRASRQALSALQLMREQMDLGLDAFGYGANEVPMTALPDRLKAFQKSLDEVFGTGKKAGTLELWDQSRLAALAAGQMTDPAKQIDQLDRMLRSETADRAAAAARLGGNADRLLKMVQDGQAKIAEAAGIDEELLAQYNDEKAQALSFGRIVDDLAFDATFIGIGRPAAAPYSLDADPAAIAPISYYGTKEGEAPSGAPSGLSEISNRFQSYAKVIEDFNASWNAVDPHAAAALGHLTGKQKNQAELDAYTTAMRDVVERSQAVHAALPAGPAEFVLTLNDYAPVDPEKNTKRLVLLKEAEALTTTVGNLQAMIEADVKRVRATDADIRFLAAIRDDLLALKSLPKGDAAQRQALLAAGMRTRLLTDVARSAMVLRKGFFYTTGLRIEAADEALHPTDDALAGRGLDARHPERYDPAQMQLALEADRAELNQYYESFAAGLAEQTATFRDKKPANPPSVEFFRAAYDDDLVNELDAAYVRSRFLDALNRSIAAQIQLGRAGAGFAARPILIPIAITPPGPSEGAQFLLGVAVTTVHFRDDPKMQGGINLRVEHPRWGDVTIGGTCYRVIDAADGPEGLATSYSKTVSLTRDVRANWTEAVPVDEAFAKILDNAFPLVAPYYAYVEVPQPGAWAKAPVIDEIEILLVKTGTRLQ